MAKSSPRLGALQGQWNVPGPEVLRALLEPEPDVIGHFYESSLASSTGAVPPPADRPSSIETPGREAASDRPALEGAPPERKGPGHAEFEIYRDADGALRWRLRAEDGRLLAESSQPCRNRASCREEISLVRKLGADAGVSEKV